MITVVVIFHFGIIILCIGNAFPMMNWGDFVCHTGMEEQDKKSSVLEVKCYVSARFLIYLIIITYYKLSGKVDQKK